MRRALFVLATALSGALPACGGGGGGDPILAANPPAGSFEVGGAFLGDLEVAGRRDLFVVDLDGDGVRKVSGALAPGGDVTAFAWSPDRARLAFVADKDADDVFELYVVGADSTQPLKVSAPLVLDGDVVEFVWSPDSQHVAYRSDTIVDEAFRLWVAPVDGSGAVQVSAEEVPLQSGLHGIFFAWAPDASRLGYVGLGGSAYEIYTVRPDGADRVQVSAPRVPGGQLKFDMGPLVAWSPDSSALAYLADQDVENQVGLYRVAPDGTGNAPLHEPIPYFDQDVTGFEWSPDGSRVAYLLLGKPSPVLPFEARLHVVHADGTNGVTATDALYVQSFHWAPDGSRIALAEAAAEYGQPFSYLYTVAADGTDHVFAVPGIRLSLAELPLAAAVSLEVSWNAAGQLLVRTSNAVGSSRGLVTFDPAVGPAAVAPMPSGRSVPQFAWSPDGTRVAYVADQDVAGVPELYVGHPGTTYGNERVSLPMLVGHRVDSFRWTADGSRLVYLADVDVLGAFTLYAATADLASTVALTPTPPFGGAVTSFELR